MAHLGGSASSVIDAPLQAVWAVVEDVLTAPQWQGGLDGMSAIEHDQRGRATLVETESDIKVRRVKARVRFDYSGAPERLSWSQEQGDMKSGGGGVGARGARRRTYPRHVQARRRSRPRARAADPRTGRGGNPCHLRQRTARRAQTTRRRRLTTLQLHVGGPKRLHV